MAVVYQSDGGTVWSAANNNTAVTVPLPATRPTGSVLLCFISHRLITGSVTTAPSGYTLVSGPHTSGTASGGRVWVYAKEVVGGEAAPTVACDGTTGTSGDLWGAMIACYSGVDTSGGIANILDATTTVQDASGTTTCTYPAITTATPCAMVVRFMRRIRDAADTFTPTAIHDEREDLSSIDRTGGQHHLQDRQGGPAGPQPAVTVVPSNTTAARYVAVSLALKTPSSYATYVVGTHKPSLYWALDGVSAGIDLSGNGRHGTAGGGVTIGGFAGGPGLTGESNTSTDFVTDDKVTSSYSTPANLLPAAGPTVTFAGGVTTGWSGFTSGTISSLSDSTSPEGDYSMRVIGGGATGSGSQLSTDLTVTSSAQYTFGCWVKAPAGAAMRVRIAETTGGTGNSDGDWVANGAWEWRTVTRTVGATVTTADLRVLTNEAVAHTFYVAGMCVVAGATISSSPGIGCYPNTTVRTFIGHTLRDTDTVGATLFAASTNSPNARLGTGTSDYIFDPDNALAGGTNTITGGWTPGNGVWGQWGFIFREAADTSSLYINGAHVDTGAQTQAYNAAPGSFQVGCRDASTNPLDGKMAHVAVFEKELTAAALLAIYTASVPGVTNWTQPVNDTGTWADAVAKAPKHPVADTGTWADAVSNRPRLTLADGATIADTVTHFWQAVQTVADGGTWTDVVTKSAGKRVNDTGTWADLASSIVGHAFAQPVNDVLTVVDALTKKPGKRPADAIAIADAFVKTARKTVADAGTWGDNWNIGAGLTKQVADTFLIADALLKAPKHPVADAAAWSDAVARAPRKAVGDTGTWSDALSRRPGKAVADTGTWADTVARAPRKVVADVLTILDLVSAGGGLVKIVADAFTVTDALLKAPKKPVADTLTAADATSARPGLLIEDTFSVWDDVILPALDAGLRIARLFMLTAGLVSRETDAQVAYNSAAATPVRSSALDTPAYETALEALSYESGAAAGAYETGIIVVETDLEIT